MTKILINISRNGSFEISYEALLWIKNHSNDPKYKVPEIAKEKLMKCNFNDPFSVDETF